MRIALVLIAPVLAFAQVPRIGSLDFYGLRKVPVERVRKALRLEPGDRLPASKADIEDRLERISGVVLAHVEAVCCTGDRAILYVGIEERGAPHADFRDPPYGAATLPREVVDAYRQFLTAFEQAARNGDTAEEFTQGHPLAANPAVRALQERFTGLASRHLAALREVLRNSRDADQRAIAAAVLGYFRDKRAVIPDLQYAMQDADESVRANAMRALGAIASTGVPVEPTWMIELLNSLLWSDRYHAAQALIGVTANRPANALDYLRERALPSLLDMARWTTPAHAEPAFALLGRIAGMPEAEIRGAWKRGDRGAVLGRFERK